MRIKVLQRPTLLSVDGLRLDRFEPGYLYDVGTALGCLFLCVGWAEPVVTEEPALLVHTKVGTEIRCRVAFRKKIDKERFEIGFEFIEPNPTFWGINFPPEDWNPADRKRADPLPKPNDPAAKGPKR